MGLADAVLLEAEAVGEIDVRQEMADDCATELQTYEEPKCCSQFAKFSGFSSRNRESNHGLCPYGAPECGIRPTKCTPLIMGITSLKYRRAA